MTSHVDRLGKRLARVEEGLKKLSRSNNLGHSSFDGGAIQQNTDDGTPGSVFGINFDGTNGVVPLTSPPPPTPEWTNIAEDVGGIIGGIRVRWGGEWVGNHDVVAPLGFSSVEVHVSDTPNFSALLFDTMKTSILSPRGGEVYISLPPGQYWVKLVCRTTAGRAGAPSAAAGPVEARAVVREDLGFDLDELAGNKVFRGPDTPVGTADAPLKYGDLWLRTPSNVAYRFEPPAPGTWNMVQDQNIVDALNTAADAAGLANQAGLTADQAHTLANAAGTAASNAQTTANQANTAAQAAASAAALAQSTAAGKVTVYRQTSAPTGGTYVVNDLWMDTDANNQLFAWSGGAWVASDDQRIASALTSASSAQTVANAKTTLFAQASAPATSGRSTGDTWVDTDDGNKVYVWNGTAWAVTLFGSAAIGATARQLGAVTTYRQSAAPVGALIAGDLWIDSDDNVLYSYSGTAWVVSQDVGIAQALTNASTAQTTANGKTTTFYQISTPSTTGRVTGDLWVDTDDGNKIYTWTGSAWAATLFSSQALNVTARQLGSITTYRQATAPASGMIAGDLWIDSDDNKLYAYQGGAWVASQDVGIQQALTAAATAQTTANGKITSYYQITAPASGMSAGDFWLDTDDGNKLYRYSGSAWVVSQDVAIQTALTNASTAQTAAGTAQTTANSKITSYYQASAPASGMVAGDFWLDTANGNKLYRYSGSAWVVTQDTAIQTALTNASTAQSTANLKTTVFYQISAPATTGRTTGDLWVDTDDGNKIYTWNGTAWTVTLFSAAALSATARQLGAITIYRQATAPASGMITGDYWIDSDDNQPYYYSGAAWVVSRDAAVNSALTNAATAQATADGKARIYYQTTAPTGLVAADLGDEWVDTDDAYVTYTWNGTAWVKNAISTSSFQPASLVVSTVAATGSVTAALLEATLVLATTIIAGNINGTHAKMQPDGFHVFRADPAGGSPMEVIRLGVASTNDFFAIVNQAGMLAASIDDTGQANLYGLNSRTDPVFQGTRFTKWIESASGIGNGNPAFPGAEHTIGWIDGSIGGVTTEVGLIEVQVKVDANRWYEVGCEVNYVRGTDTEAVFRVRDGGTGSPTITSPEIFRRNFSNGQAFFDITTGPATGIWYPTTSGVHRLILTAMRQGPGVVDIHTLLCLPTIICRDMGPRKPVVASVNRGGGAATAPPSQQYVDLAPAGYARFNGSSVLRNDTAEVISGYDPSGFNGDGKGYWYFNLPTITGTVDRVDFYSFSNHWYYNSGGTALYNCSDVNGTASPNFTKRAAADHQVGFSGAPSGVTTTLPSSWYNLFKTGNVPRVNAITVGPGGGTNETYYGRFDGPSARLRIWYTQ